MHLIEDAIKTAREEHVTVELNNSLFEGVGFPEEILEGMLHQEEGVPSPTETEACRQESLGQRVVIVFVGYGKRSWKILRGALFSDDTYWLCKGINKKAKIPIDKPWEKDLVIPLITWGISLTFICGVSVMYHSLFFAIAAIILGIICLIGIWTLLQQRKELRQQQKELRRQQKELRRLNWMLKIERRSREYLLRKMKVQESRSADTQAVPQNILQQTDDLMTKKDIDLTEKYIPLELIERELTQKMPPDLSLFYWEKLNTLLANSKAWLSQMGSIREKILAKQQEEMQMNMHITAQAGSCVNGMVQQQTNNGIAANRQIAAL